MIVTAAEATLAVESLSVDSGRVTSREPDAGQLDGRLAVVVGRVRGLGDAQLAQDMAAALFDEGVYVSGFFFPVVPRGQARIRTQMNAALTREELTRALAAFGKVGRDLGVIS